MREGNIRLLVIAGLIVSVSAFVVISLLYILEMPHSHEKMSTVDDSLNITLYPGNGSVEPGGTLPFYFEITNKKTEVIKQINIKMRISYFGQTVYEKEGASIRDYPTGKIIRVYPAETLPLIAPPGDYKAQFYFTPQNLNERYLEYNLHVKPSLYQILLLFLASVVLGFLTINFDENFRYYIIFMRRDFSYYPVWQKFMLFGVFVLAIAAITLALQLEYLSTQFSIIAYLLLVIGIANNLLEYFRLGNPKINYTLSLYAFSLFTFLSTYNGIDQSIGKILATFTATFATFSFINQEKKSQRKILMYLAVLLLLWMIFDILQKTVPLYAIGILFAFLWQLSRKGRINF